MKKIVTLTLTLFTMAILVGCQPKEEQSQPSSTASTAAVVTQKAKITLKEGNTPFTTKEIQFNQGTSLYDAMKANFTIQDENGFITAIDDHRQDKSQNKYWTYTVNGEMATKGAKDLILKENDTIVFNLDVTQ